MEIYVDESKIKLYVSKEAPISQDCLYADETKLVSWFEESECELEHEDCQLLLLEDRLAEERKKVVKEAKKLVVEATCYDTEEEVRNHLYDMSASEVLELLDQVERGDDSNVATKNN